MYLFRRFLLLAITTKSSAYLTRCTDKGIRVFFPSANLTESLCSADLVNGQIDSFAACSRPSKVKFANVGDIIPPWGVPESGSVCFPPSRIFAFNHCSTSFFKPGCKHIFSSSQSWFILLKNPLISASRIHLSWLGFKNIAVFVFPLLYLL